MKQHYSSIISQLFGKFANSEFNPKIQNIINNSYVKLMKLDMSDFNKPNSYKTLNKLFTRELAKSRSIDASTTSIISPCDSKIIDLGKISQSKAYQIKGMSYSVKDLIQIENLQSAKVLDDGDYINFYLSPKDYHRYHAPFDIEILNILYIPGKLYPVNMPLLKNKTNLYIENERVVIKVKDRFNHIHFLVLVGALNVGKMVVTFDSEIDTNIKGAKRIFKEYSEPIKLKKGDLFGWFEMGSTIVMLSQKDAINRWDVELMQSVKFADLVGELNED